MKRNRRYNFLSILLLLALFLTSCGGGEADTIATAVAMTVSAQETERAQAAVTPTEAASSQEGIAEPTSTSDAADVTSTPEQAVTFSPPTAPPPVGSGPTCILASYITETIPDGTVMQPGENFWKSWTIQNNGTCTWDSSYKFVFDSGELMGGFLEYPLPEVVPPGDQIEIAIYLKAPLTNGNYRGNWKILSPWGGTFGVSEYNTPLWVQVNVNDSSNPEYGVTNVTYQIVRKPAAGCDTNVWYTVYATITTNGPATVKFQWLQSDGNNSSPDPGPNYTLKFTEADSRTISREWSFHLGATPGTKWMQLVIVEPNYTEYPRATFSYECGN